MAFATQLFAGAVAGHVRLVDSRDSAVKKRGDFSNVVVWLTSPEASAARIPRRHAQMLQKEKKFSPHILAIATGTSVDFPNLDPIFHNAFSNFNGQIFDVALYPPGSSKSVRFDRPGIVRIFCNIHPSMSGVIVVVDSSYFATTEADGSFSLPNVSPGAYTIHFFHERATPETLEKLRRTINVNDEGAELPEAIVSEAGYLPIGHKNKYDRDYPLHSDEAPSYSSPVK
jgi:plastocyanin